ncbi:LamG domain-containing protein [Hymenobacter sp. GOD-10R]|uniref:LamG domain-containing protein n=1 Tax=Hymenobacter sp. GOD-10R TaxID=3093922 RepID=UPI002D782A36|nr:LamG domain-containing protein [Hymenobacter sp. GOD-10R]WRQ29343.1 LamG domain-containing protein [Hymenobacter sp. GOD-10R]
MKRHLFYLLILPWLLVGFATALSSCSDSDDDDPQISGDKTKLTALIDSVTVGYNAAVEGTKPGNYTVGSKAALRSALDLAINTRDDAKYTQLEVNNATANLRRAVAAFRSGLIQEVSVANLVAQWKFEGNANDATANGNNGLLKSGPTGPGTAPGDGGVVPQLVADRFGRANQAYELNNGAYIEVPYKAALNPQALTISLWCKRFDANDNNYIVSLNRWNGFKLQLQGAGKPFFTASTTATIFDRDSEAGIVPVNTWAHVVTSYVDGTLKFYINGVLVKTWTNTQGALKTVPEPVNLAIGQQLPKEVYNRAPTAGQTADYFTYYNAAFFKGQLDDIRFYNRALTDAEVTSIYTIERSL